MVRTGHWSSVCILEGSLQFDKSAVWGRESGTDAKVKLTFFIQCSVHFGLALSVLILDCVYSYKTKIFLLKHPKPLIFCIT